jgi:hypothetical protein
VSIKFVKKIPKIESQTKKNNQDRSKPATKKANFPNQTG